MPDSAELPDHIRLNVICRPASIKDTPYVMDLTLLWGLRIENMRSKVVFPIQVNLRIISAIGFKNPIV